MEGTNPLGTSGDGRYRVVPEDLVVQRLVYSAWPFEARRSQSAAECQARAALERLTRLGLPFRSENGQRLFDGCEVINFTKAAGLAGADSTYHDHVVPTARRLASAFLPAAQSQPAPARFLVSLQRTFNLGELSPGSTARLRLPLPCDDMSQGDVALEVAVPGVPTAEWTAKPGRLEVRLPVAGAEALVQANIALTTWPRAVAVEPHRLQPFDHSSPDYQLFTRPREGLIQVTPAVAELAEIVAGGATDAWTALEAFWGFFFQRMRSGFIHHDELDPADPLTSLVRGGWFDCYSGSSLLVGLCRARGIPARLVSGLTLYHTLSGFHFWVEVLLPPYGWVPFDLICVDLAVGRLDQAPWSHLFFGRMDYRMKCECYPDVFIGPPGARFPASWFLHYSLRPDGCETSYLALDPVRLLMRDTIQVTRPAALDAEMAR